MLQDFEPPSGEIAKQIEADFGSLDKLIPVFNAKTAAISGLYLKRFLWTSASAVHMRVESFVQAATCISNLVRDCWE